MTPNTAPSASPGREVCPVPPETALHSLMALVASHYAIVDQLRETVHGPMPRERVVCRCNVCSFAVLIPRHSDPAEPDTAYRLLEHIATHYNEARRVVSISEEAVGMYFKSGRGVKAKWRGGVK